MEGYADGVIDFAAAVSDDGTATGAAVKPEALDTAPDGTKSPNNLYYETLAQQYVLDSDSVDGITGDGEVTGGDDLYPVAEWALNATGADTGAGTGDPAAPAYHDAALTDVSWSPGQQVDYQAGKFNGSSSYADLALPLNTARSFTVAAWVRVTDKSADRVILTRNATGNASMTFQYRKSDDKWVVVMPSATSGDNIAMPTAISDAVAKTGVWTHLAAVYDASVNSLDLYVNGDSQTGADAVTPFNDPDGATWLGRSRSNWFAGDITDARVWVRALGDAEVQAEARPATPMVNWQFEDQSLPTTATDSSPRSDADLLAPGTFSGGVTYKQEGHPSPDGDSGGIDTDRGAITLDGTTGAVSTRARVRTDQSFTVASWARITNTTRDQTTISQYGTHASGFQLGFGTTCKCWKVSLPATDAANPTTITVQSTTAAAINTWTHVAAVYDAGAGTLQLYVNGVGTAAAPVPARTWNATGPFTTGRALRNDAAAEYFAGDIDDVYAYQQALTTDEVDNLRRKEAPQG
ncbi:LamG domain-containing protein [Actinoplanes sp. TFC3]|uniref:LamG domain-containing protein n=1 Tax=Actinoplanes sp. TFC3 TaxID=1710355 RepID=UPI000830A6B8|nr:LamG domain-containing protein [Actinoplanes sp. TFC3]